MKIKVTAQDIKKGRRCDADTYGSSAVCFGF